MLRNYLKTAFRNLWKNKGFTAINMGGLAIGMASAILILLWVQNELSYDRFHEKTDRLYQAWNRGVFSGSLNCWSSTPKILAPTLKKDYPEIEEVTRVNWNNNFLFTVGEKRLNVSGTMVDTGFLHMFSFPLLKGNPNTALSQTYSIILTEKLVKKLYGNEDPMGKTIKLDNKDLFTITGIMKDLPNNTRFDFEYLLPWQYMHVKNYDDSNWDNNSTQTYVLLKPNVQIADLNKKIKNITIDHLNGREKIEVFLYELNKLRLYGNFENGKPSGGGIVTVRVFSIIAVLILLIACINFMNLSTARSEKRAKEVGIRKVAGALKQSLIFQFLGESVLISLLSGMLAFVIVILVLPSFNLLVSKDLRIEYGNINFWLAGLAFVLFTGIIAGSYPAFFLSSFQPVAVLKGTFKKINALITPRKLLVVTQFSIAIVLIISTIIIRKQLKYGQERETGYNRSNLAYVFIEGDIYKNYTLIKNELISQGIATGISQTSAPVTQGWSDSWGFIWEGKDPNDKTDFDRYSTDGNLVKTIGMKIVDGRDINLDQFPSDSAAMILNESAVKAMSLKNPVGQIIRDDDRKYHVVGVIKDFILHSPFEPMHPMVIEGPQSGFINVINIKFDSARNLKQSLAATEKIFKKYNPEFPFNAHFVDEEYANKFNDESTQSILATVFSGLTIFISCLGLLGLATYMAENRVKEIGVRKVLGASVTQITTLLSKDFLRLVFISIIIACPIAWWAMHSWLAGYKYKIEMSWWIFVLSGLLAISIALLTVSYQAIRAGFSNPSKSLRSE